MSDRNGIRVWMATPQNGKPWAWVQAPRAAPVAFSDLYEMIRYICMCEVRKYAERKGIDPSTREAWETFTNVPREFLRACCAWDADYETLANRFGLPR